MRSLWDVSKYMTLPGDRVGVRSMLFLRELHKLGWTVTAFASDSNHLVAGPEFAGDHLVRNVDGVEVCWVRTRKYRGAKSLGRILSWLDFEYRLTKLPKDRYENVVAFADALSEALKTPFPPKGDSGLFSKMKGLFGR